MTKSIYSSCTIYSFESCLQDCLYSPLTSFAIFSFIAACWILLLSSSTPRNFYTSSCLRSWINVFQSSSIDVAPVNFPLLKVALAHLFNPNDIPTPSRNFFTVYSKPSRSLSSLTNRWFKLIFWMFLLYTVRFSSFRNCIKDRRKSNGDRESPKKIAEFIFLVLIQDYHLGDTRVYFFCFWFKIVIFVSKI